ncbi:MAG: universal stress protein [Gemmatimonadaceae bacterium]
MAVLPLDAPTRPAHARRPVVIAPLAVAPASVAPAAPLIVALAGRSDDSAVVAAAGRLSARLDARAIAISVRVMGRDMGVEIGMTRYRGTGERGAERRRRIRATLRCAPGDAGGWPVEIESGTVAGTLARVAAGAEARLVVMGASRHTTLDQLLGTETTLQVLREVDRPVLVVRPTFDALPRRVLVATDFGPAACRAADEALALLPRGGILTLAHVLPRSGDRLPPRATWGSRDGRRASELLDELAYRLDPPAGVSVEPVELTGDPAEAILSHAAATGAELIGMGVSGTPFQQRMFVGSVSTSLLRRASCSVLASP